MFVNVLENFRLNEIPNTLFQNEEVDNNSTVIESIKIKNIEVKKYINEFWTAKQRQANSIHEVSYRACFKPQLPRFFITNLTKENDFVYDPFLGRGTTIIEAGLLNRQVIGNDVNPLSKILSESRFLIPKMIDLVNYLEKIPFQRDIKADIDLSMFYYPDTESEIVSLRNYILEKEKNNKLTNLDKWIRMVATNRLTGHSKGFFSVYTMPPNQAVSQKRQIKINEKRNQKPEYRNVKKLIIRKTISLIKDISILQRKTLKQIHNTAIFLNNDARETKTIPDNFVQLTVTSPPFLNIVQYAKDNWLRGWFNGINIQEIEKKIIKVQILIELYCLKRSNLMNNKKLSYDLQGVIAQMLKPLKDLPFGIVIEGLSGHKVKPYSKKSKKDKKVLSILKKIAEEVLSEINKKGISRSRANEVGNDIESYVKNALNNSKKIIFEEFVNFE